MTYSTENAEPTVIIKMDWNMETPTGRSQVGGSAAHVSSQDLLDARLPSTAVPS